MQVEIRRISIRSAFKLAMVLYGLIGFLVGLVLAVAAGVEPPPGTEPNILTRLGFWSIAVFPALYGPLQRRRFSCRRAAAGHPRGRAGIGRPGARRGTRGAIPGQNA